MISVRVVVIDHYQSRSIKELSDEQILAEEMSSKEPVIRIFGPTTDGVKTCVHVHGVYPYMYVPYRGGEEPERDALRLAAALEKALAVGCEWKHPKFVHRVVHTSGIPLYGYHSGPRQFFKIYFLNPYYIRRASELLLSGAILGQRFQPHESHIPFTLQFMIDYNISGMGFVNLERVKHRRSPGNPAATKGVDPKDLLPERVKRTTHSLWEVDVLAEDIVNGRARSWRASAPSNPGLRAIREEERARRRARGSSRATPGESQPRPEARETASEAAHRRRLAQRLRNAAPPEAQPSQEGLPLSYPAEVPPNSGDLLEASTIGIPRADRSSLEDFAEQGDLIDETLVAEVTASHENGDGGEWNLKGVEEEDEDDSILGRNRGRDDAEAELRRDSEEEEEEEEEGEMTQPLQPLEPRECASESDRDADRDAPGEEDSEDEFWRSMAQKIMQLDGTDDLSDDEIRRSAGGGSDRQPQQKRQDAGVEGILGSTAAAAAEGGWPTGLLSVLNEGAGCPTAQPICHSQHPFWEGWSPRATQPEQLWSGPNNPDPWTWDKSDAAFLESLSYGPRKGKAGGEEDFPAEAIASEELYGFPGAAAAGEYLQGNYAPTPTTMSPASNVGPAYVSPPSAILTPVSEVDNCSDGNLDSVCETANRLSTSPSPHIEFAGNSRILESKTVTVPRAETTRPATAVAYKELTDAVRQFSEARKNPQRADNRVKMVALTLKQYIATCDEIVNVDFKNISGREMVVVEYKSVNSKSNQSKYLIKPVEKFLEDWTATEEKLNNRARTAADWPKLVNGFARPETATDEEQQLAAILNTLENKYTGSWLDASKIKSIKNRFVVKSMEVLPENGDAVPTGRRVVKGGEGKSYKVNENLISGGKIKMKLIKDRREDVARKNAGNPCEKGGRSGAGRRGGGKVRKASLGRLLEKAAVGRRCSGEEEKEDRETEGGLIEQLNRSFEDYFGDLVKIEASSAKNEARPPEEADSSSGGLTDEDEEEEEEAEVAAAEGESDAEDADKASADAVKFVAQLLSAFSSFSRSSTTPPLSITVNFGGVRSGSSVQLKLQSGSRRKRRSKNLFVSNVDGPADESSSGESLEEREATRTPSKKRARKELAYRPLHVIIQKTPATPSRRRRAASERDGQEEASAAAADVSCVPRRGSDHWRGRSQAAARRRQAGKEPAASGSGAEQEIEGENLTRLGENARGSKRLPQRDEAVVTEGSADSSAGEQFDFIEDSEEESGARGRCRKKRRRLKKLLRKVGRKPAKPARVPQTDAVATSDGEEAAAGESERRGAGGEAGVGSPPGAPDPGEVRPGSLPPSLVPAVALQAEEVAVNSDDSLRRTDSSERNRDVVPFELSGTALHAEEVGTPASGLRPSTRMRPKFGPPSFGEVKATLREFNFPETVSQTPYYSDPRDASPSIEVAEKMFAIENSHVAGLKSHVSEVVTSGTEERRETMLSYRRKWKRSLRPILADRRERRLTPLRKPPKREEVFWWREGESGGQKQPSEEAEEANARKMRVPRSPGQAESDSEEEEIDLTVTPSSPEGPFAGLGERRALSGSSVGTPTQIPGTRERPSDRPSSPMPEEEEAEPASAVRRSGEECGRSADSSFGIGGITADNSFGFAHSVDCPRNARTTSGHEQVTTLILEVHARTRGDLRPDPQHDPIRAVFYTLAVDAAGGTRSTGAIAVGEGALAGVAPPPLAIDHVADEEALLEQVLRLLRTSDPDILAGYEIELQSWGYLFQRSFVLGKNLFSAAGRVLEEDPRKEGADETAADDWDDVPKQLRRMRITGRIVLDVWRLLRHEVALTSYTFENVMYHLLRERYPCHSYRTLSLFWEHPTRRYRHITAEYYATRTEGIARLLDHLDFVSRNSELARLFGIQFFEVLSRGSQFRVESMMLRLAKPLNYVACSPSIRQRAGMRAPASLPLIMEPESKFYADPIVVLDFQSLYPSMIIAYNYCFSTCLGRVEVLGGREPFEFGCTHLQITPEEIKGLEKDVHISPAGVAFVRANVRKGILPRMLEEILEARLAVKKATKECREDKMLQKVLHARQLGLKLIANVTYGYTAANFSGRMPCVEVGDSVVSKGRETLQRAIEMVKLNRNWDAEVVYGDTDSLFVLLRGRTREEAFRIGAEIADAVTRDNPKPVKLKLEKVYQPSILQTKKRYVGYMYETVDQEKPTFDAKGIETVRRDGCPATGKVLHKALRILFETRDVSQVKRYAIRQFAKIFEERVGLDDLVFAKEYRGRRGYRPGACVPALELARQRTRLDRRAEPRVKERVPYVVVNGAPGLPLIRLVRGPRDLLADPTLRINAVYYVTKAIAPALHRCFSLLGADVAAWYSEMPRRFRAAAKATRPLCPPRGGTISQYFSAVRCPVCGEATPDPICGRCLLDEQKVAIVLHEKVRRWERSRDGVTRICESCCGRKERIECESLDCPVLYRLRGVEKDSQRAAALRERVEMLVW